MAMKDFDAKQFMLEKGERVGLGVALFLMVLLIIVSLFLPSRGFFSGNPKEKADALSKTTEEVNRTLHSAGNVPSGDNLPPDPKTTLAAITEFNPIKPGAYEFAGLFAPTQLGPSKRKLPELLLPQEGRAVAFQLQAQGYMMEQGRDGLLVYVLEGDDLKTSPGAGNLPSMFRPGAGKGGSGRGGVGGGMPSIMGPGGRGGSGGMGAGRYGPSAPGRFGGAPNMPGMIGAEGNKKDMKLVPIRMDKLGESPNVHFAEQVLPLRAAEIVASFPYRAQLEEFRDKLHLPTTADVLNEPAVPTSGDESATPPPAFRFLGVRVQRCELGPDGKPIGAFKDVPLKEAYTPYLIVCGKRFEPEDPKYAEITFPGLVMPRLKLFRPPDAQEEEKDKDPHNKYPDLEEKLPTLKKTVDEIASRGVDKTLKPKKPAQFTVDEKFDVFQPQADENTPTGEGMVPPAGIMPPNMKPGRVGSMVPPTGVMPPGMKMGRPGMMVPPAGVSGETGQESAPPEYCLVRVIDPTVVPGHTYQYRLQVRMANPNYGRKDVASPSYAAKAELDPPKRNSQEEWYVVPSKVKVPPELYYYAVDQKELDGNSYSREKRLNWDKYLGKDKAVLQIHRWLEGFTLKNTEKVLPVGEWVIAERVIAGRGEYVGHSERIEFPYWRPTQEAFVIAADRDTKIRNPGVPVSFKPEGTEGKPLPDTLLVDFEGGRESYTRVTSRATAADPDAKPQTKKVDDACANEMLLLTPDGKLLALDGGKDAKDEERKERLKLVKERIKKVKEEAAGGGNQPGGAKPGKGGGSPFPGGT